MTITNERLDELIRECERPPRAAMFTARLVRLNHLREIAGALRELRRLQARASEKNMRTRAQTALKNEGITAEEARARGFDWMIQNMQHVGRRTAQFIMDGGV